MAFKYRAETTTAGAADEIVDWFATFQNWMLSIGWTVEAGGGTQDITFRSLSEAGALTMLYLRVWRDLINVNRVYFRVQDDLAGTHVTTPVAGGYVDSGGVQFAFWLSGDMDAIVVVFKLGAGYMHVYAGMVIPFALTVPDETYRMIVTNDLVAGAILRNHTGIWDVDATLSVNPDMTVAGVDPFDSSLSIPGTYFGTGPDIAGQLMHISGQIQTAGITAQDTIATGRPGATTTWIVLSDTIGRRFALRTGGVLPTGIPDGTFASVSGVAANQAAIYTALAGILVGLGWTDLGDPGVDDSGRLFFSRGQSGEENIYVLFSLVNATSHFNLHVQDDSIGTNRATHWERLRPTDFPANYWISADKDCVVMAVQIPLGYLRWWAGMVAPFAGGLVAPYPAGPSLSEYSMVASCQGDRIKFTPARLLRQHDGAWLVNTNVENEGVPMTNCNPNAFDGVTYLVWPCIAVVGVGNVVVGQMKYLFFTDGGGIANLDTITVGAKVYTVFFDDVVPIPKVFVLRTT